MLGDHLERGSIKTIIFSNFETLVELRNRGFSFETITKALNESANLELKSGTVRKNFNRAKEYFSNPENIQIKQNLRFRNPSNRQFLVRNPKFESKVFRNFGNGLFEESKQTETRQQVSKVSASKPIQPEVKQVQPKPVENSSDQPVILMFKPEHNQNLLESQHRTRLSRSQLFTLSMPKSKCGQHVLNYKMPISLLNLQNHP